MGSRRRPLGRSYSGTGRYSTYSPGQSSDGEDNNGPLVESRPERRSYLLSVRPENSLPTNRLSPSNFGRSTFCTIIAQLTEETQPLFETTLRSYAVSEDADAKFTCIVTGYPQPEVTWYKDDEEMDRYCGLPKYEIFRHGNRHTLQLYRCGEEDAAIYQASARNSKGIVSCSGVLEVGTMTEYKIHQRWFAKLKRKAEAKLREIEQSRKRGKENMEMEQLRRVSPDRFQRKRRLTGEVGMRSGASLWDKEEVAKVHIPDGKPRFSEDDRAKGKGPPINAATLFSNNFITGRLEAEVSTNGDSSLENGEENGEENTNGFLTYIYETVESIKNKPVTKDFSAKKKKKEEETTALPNANQDIFLREGGTQQRRNTVTQRDVRPVVSSENTPSLATNGEQMEAESKDLPSWVTEKRTPLPYSMPSNADVYFSLKDMYFDIRAKPEVEQKSSEEKASRADMCPAGVDVPRWEETPPTASVALERLKPPNEPSAEEEAKDKDASETQNNKTAPERAGGLNTTSLQYHNWSTAPTAEGQPSLRMGDTARISDNSISKADAQPPPSWAAETDAGAKEKAMLYANLRETDLLDSLPTDDAEPDLPPQTLPQSAAAEPCVDSSLHMQKAAGEPEGPCEAPETLQPAESAVHNLSHSPDSALREENKQEAGYLTIRERAPVETGDEWSKKRDSPNPETQESRMVVVSQENNQYTSVTSQNPPAVSLSSIQPTGQDNLVLTEDVGRLSPSFERDEIQHRKAPSPERKELVAPGSPAQRADLESRSSDRLDQGVPQTEPVIREKQEQTSQLLRDNSLDLKMDLGLEAERTPVVTARPLLLPEVAVGTPVPYQNALGKPHPVPTVVVPQARHESQGPPAVLSPVNEGLAERNQSVAHLLKDVQREMDARPPVNGFSVEKGQAKEGSLSPLMGEENGQRGLILGKEVGAKERERTAPATPAIQDLPQPEMAMEEEKAQNANLVSSLKNYLLLLLKMTTETEKSKGSPKQEVKAVEERSPLSAIPRHLPEVGIAGLTPRTSRKIFEQVETDQLFQSAESLQLTPKTSRRITGMINRELLACQESLAAEPEAPPLPCVPSIVVGGAPGEPLGLPDLSPGSPSEAPAALPSATPQELASGARRKIYLPKAKPSDEMEGAVPDGQERPQRESPTVSPQQSRKNASLLQTPSPASSPPVERRSPTLARKMATLEVPKIYEEPAEESKDVADSSPGALEGLEKTGPEGQTGESRKANDPFKAPQVIRKIRAEQFSDASGNLKLWCQFFNILSDSKLTWYKDEIPVTDVRRSSGDEGQAALAIVQVSLKDCGVYQCTIQNEYGTDSTDFLLSAEVLSGFISKEEIEVGEEIEMTPMVFAKGLADSGFWGDKLFGRIMMEDLEVGPGFLRKACRARAIYGLEPVFESGHTGIIKVRNLIAFGGRSESTLVERNYDITIQECKIQNSSREYCKIFAAEARAIPAFGAVPEIIPLYLIYRPANNIPYATMEEDLPGKFERYCGRARDSSSLAPASASEVGHKCCTFQHWLYQWTNGNILVTDLEGVGWKITNVRIATKAKGYQGLKESFCPNLLEHFAASHQCNRYCELLALKSLDLPQPPARSKGSRSPNTGRKAPSAQSSPQLPKKGLASPQAPRKGSVSPKSARKSPEAAETQEAARPQAGDSGKAGRRQ